MIRFIIPFVALCLFFLEPVFSLFSPIVIEKMEYILVPRFVIVYLVFIAIYYDQRRAIIYGLTFGLLYDMFHIDIIGVYTFLYPLICFLGAWLIRQVYKHIAMVMLLSLFLIVLLEVLLYFFGTIIALTTMEMNEFIVRRLAPTMIANSIFIGMFGWFFKYVLTLKQKQKRAG